MVMSCGLKNILVYRFGSILQAEAEVSVYGRYQHFLWLAGCHPADGRLASLTPHTGILSACHQGKLGSPRGVQGPGRVLTCTDISSQTAVLGCQPLPSRHGGRWHTSSVQRVSPGSECRELASTLSSLCLSGPRGCLILRGGRGTPISVPF